MHEHRSVTYSWLFLPFTLPCGFTRGAVLNDDGGPLSQHSGPGRVSVWLKVRLAICVGKQALILFCWCGWREAAMWDTSMCFCLTAWDCYSTGIQIKQTHFNGLKRINLVSCPHSLRLMPPSQREATSIERLAGFSFCQMSLMLIWLFPKRMAFSLFLTFSSNAWLYLEGTPALKSKSGPDILYVRAVQWTAETPKYFSCSNRTPTKQN